MITGCSKLSDGVEFNYVATQKRDFKNSRINSTGPRVANGSLSLVFNVVLLNSDNSPVEGFTPEYTVIIGTGVTPFPCSPTDAQGVATCSMKSVKAGAKRISITNVDITLQTDLMFTLPATGDSQFSVTAASAVLRSGAHTFTATVGSNETGIKKTNGTYSFYGSVQGAEFSR
ncbi:MAG: hypothetical protein EOP05_06015 [Proteobacteria bacterium]|nr:MAG: hypothetical protein EOP05_06015 [Pseudomonadota bacterium]